MSYTKDNPKWVQAQTVKVATSNGRFVDVIAYGETFKDCQVRWGDPFLNKAKSDVLVQNSRGDWLRVWFYDEDILPFETAHHPRTGANVGTDAVPALRWTGA